MNNVLIHNVDVFVRDGFPFPIPASTLTPVSTLAPPARGFIVAAGIGDAFCCWFGVVLLVSRARRSFDRRGGGVGGGLRL